MTPDLEVVQIRRGESFTAWSHGYPFHTVRWHFHPEYELHHVVATTGRYFVGDFIGEFEPGNLVLTGPNLPHNWVSDVPDGTSVPLRGRIVQFTEELHRRCHDGAARTCGAAPACSKRRRRGVLFSRRDQPSRCRRCWRNWCEAQGVRRIELFMAIVGILSRATDVAHRWPAPSYLPDPSGYMSAGINKALAYIRPT